MLTRPVSAVVLLMLVAGCAANNPEQSASSSSSSASPAASAPAALAPSSSSSSGAADLPLPSTEPSAGKPTAGGAQTITGTVTAGVEPNCLVLSDGAKSHLLIFDDASLRASAPVGKRVTLTGRSEPSMMSTCQQGVPFIVTSVNGG